MTCSISKAVIFVLVVIVQKEPKRLNLLKCLKGNIFKEATLLYGKKAVILLRKIICVKSNHTRKIGCFYLQKFAPD